MDCVAVYHPKITFLDDPIGLIRFPKISNTDVFEIRYKRTLNNIKQRSVHHQLRFDAPSFKNTCRCDAFSPFCSKVKLTVRYYTAIVFLSIAGLSGLSLISGFDSNEFDVSNPLNDVTGILDISSEAISVPATTAAINASNASL